MPDNRNILIALALILSLAGGALSGVRAALAQDSEIVKISRDVPSAASATASFEFGVDGRLQKNVDFWVQIYTHYTTRQGVVHDSKYVDHIYETLDFSTGRSPHAVHESVHHWRQVLLSVHHKQLHPDQLNAQERRVFEMFSDIQDPNKFLAAAHRKRLRFQLGQKDRFVEGLRQSGKYLPLMEEIFRKQGLPTELTRLPFVESSFNLRARSKVGASGIWQFMRSTGRLYLRIDDSVDERNDPILETEAAAKLLKQNYDSLKSWPLAVTAYNHGRMGLMRAVRRVGSDKLSDLVDEYRSRSFGFASSNFFVELLSVVEAEKNADRYFGKVERDAPVTYIEAEIPNYVRIQELTRFLKLDRKKLRELNPALTEAVFTGRRLIPAGYRLRMPFDGKGTKEASVRLFMAGFAAIPQIYKHDAEFYGRQPSSTTRRLKRF